MIVNSVVVIQPDKTAEVLTTVNVKGVKSCMDCLANSKDNTLSVTDPCFVLQQQQNQKGKKRKDRELYYHLDSLIVNIK